MMFGDETPELAAAVEVEAAPRRRASCPARELGAVVLVGSRARRSTATTQEVGLRDVGARAAGRRDPRRRGRRRQRTARAGGGDRRPAQPAPGAVLLGDEDVTRLGVGERERRGSALRHRRPASARATVARPRRGDERGPEADRRVGRSGARAPSAATRSTASPSSWSRTTTCAPPRRPARGSRRSPAATCRSCVLARELAVEPQVRVFNKPTHGLDVRTAEFVRDQIREAARRRARGARDLDRDRGADRPLRPDRGDVARRAHRRVSRTTPGPRSASES